MVERTHAPEFADTFPKLVVDFALGFEHTALVIIDMQNLEVKPEHGFAKIIHDRYPEIGRYLFPRMEQVVIPNIMRLLEAFRDASLPVIFLTVGPLLADGRDMHWVRRMRDVERVDGDTHAAPGSAAAAVIAELKPRLDELVLQKNSLGAFNSTAIDQILRNMDINELVITGTATDACVETTARDAADRGYRCYLVEDACATYSERQQEATIEAFARYFGQVRSTDQVLAELAASRAAAPGAADVTIDGK